MRIFFYGTNAPCVTPKDDGLVLKILGERWTEDDDEEERPIGARLLWRSLRGMPQPYVPFMQLPPDKVTVANNTTAYAEFIINERGPWEALAVTQGAAWIVRTIPGNWAFLEVSFVGERVHVPDPPERIVHDKHVFAIWPTAHVRFTMQWYEARGEATPEPEVSSWARLRNNPYE